MKHILYLVPVILVLCVVGCSKDDTTNPTTGQGEIKMLLVDNPATYDAVNVVVTRIEAHTAGSDTSVGWSTIRTDSVTFDLLKLTNGASAILGSSKLAIGKYTQLRLILGNGSNVLISGVQYPLEIPSGMKSGLKLTHNFDIEESKLYELFLDFDAERSINKQGSIYKLNPTIRIEAVVTSGTISGTVLPVAAKAKIWTFSGSDMVSAFADTTGRFKLVALPSGQSYSVNFVHTAGTYGDMAVIGVGVAAGTDTNLGTITLP